MYCPGPKNSNDPPFFEGGLFYPCSPSKSSWLLRIQPISARPFPTDMHALALCFMRDELFVLHTRKFVSESFFSSFVLCVLVQGELRGKVEVFSFPKSTSGVLVFCAGGCNLQKPHFRAGRQHLAQRTKPSSSPCLPTRVPDLVVF